MLMHPRGSRRAGAFGRGSRRRCAESGCRSIAGTPGPGQNAGAGGQTFACDDGSTLAVSIVPAGQVSVANVVSGDGTQVALIAVPSAVGTKYTDGTATLVVNGTSDQWVSGGAPKFCVSQ